jgi:hypothetical protein
VINNLSWRAISPFFIDKEGILGYSFKRRIADLIENTP